MLAENEIIPVKKYSLTKHDRGYFKIRKNRVEVLKNIVDNNKKFSIKNIDCKRIYDIFYFYKESIYDALLELGYKLEDICDNIPNGYYLKSNIMEEKINNFIEVNKRFPKLKEIEKELNIDYSHIYNKYGSMENMKKALQYNGEKELIDLRGDLNKSFLELYIANYLILQGFKDNYKREQYPFPNENYRSDFTLYLENGKEFHIEVWGSKRKCITRRGLEYNKIRTLKENLYKEHSEKILFIGIDCEIFDNSYDEINKILYKTLNKHLKLPLKEIKYKNILNISKLSDDELFNQCMIYSKDKTTLPDIQDIAGTLYNEILKRFNEYQIFADNYNVRTPHYIKNWSKELIFSHFENMINANIFINKPNCIKEYKNLSDRVTAFGGTIQLKLDFFYKYISNGKVKLPHEEINWLENIINNKGTGIKNKVTPTQQELAKEILSNCKQYVSL